MAPHHFALMVLVCLVWGFNFVAGKAGVAHFPPLLFTALRFVMVGLLLAPLLRFYPGRMSTILMIGVLAGFLHFGLMFIALTVADVSIMAIVTQLNVPFVTLLSILLLGEHVRWKRGLGITLSFFGVMVISFDPAVLDQWLGVVLTASGALCMAFAMILMRQIQGVSPLGLQAWIALISAPTLLLGSFAFETGHWESLTSAGLLEWSAVTYTALGASLIGHGGMYYLLQRYEASLTGPLTVMAPIFSIFFGVTLLGEPITARLLIGGAITLLGVVVVAFREAQATGHGVGSAQGEALAPDLSLDQETPKEPAP